MLLKLHCHVTQKPCQVTFLILPKRNIQLITSDGFIMNLTAFDIEINLFDVKESQTVSDSFHDQGTRILLILARRCLVSSTQKTNII